ncbi:S-adenosyl-L-methionine-dependent methyltransferase [Chytriomyces sp. MP71]|nr:S-adenosyl-L-methionine-dependent methyltransferase [Chytriomyces sp. MP71]
MESDRIAVVGTNDDATVSRLSAISLGYWQDPFTAAFVKPRAAQRKPPIINRGTYTRYSAIQTLVTRFLESSEDASKDRQIVVAGAGFDTRFFAAKSAQTQPKLYVEIDLPEVTARKAQTVKKNAEMTKLLGEHKLGAFHFSFHVACS